jgi:hypothetical protein
MTAFRVVRGGYAAAEAVVVLALSALIAACLAAALLTQSRVVRAVSERVAYNDVSRVVLHVLPAELRWLDPARDIRAFSHDSIAARWVRASGTICAVQGSMVWLRLRGMRQPDDGKDSLLVITAADERVLPLNTTASDDTRCHAGDGERIYRTTMNAPPAGAVVLIFESGTYYVTQHALRYRIGGEGRQPLTAELLRDAGTRLELAPADSSHTARFQITLALSGGHLYADGHPRDFSMLLPNARWRP